MLHRPRSQGKACKHNLLRQIWPMTTLESNMSLPQLPELAAFAQAVPTLTIILNHLGGLTRVGPYANRDDEVLATWRRGLAAVAACPNVYLKLGGIGMPRLGFDWHTRSTPIGSEELARVLPTSLRDSQIFMAYSHPYERNPMTWRLYNGDQAPFARRPPTRPIGGPI